MDSQVKWGNDSREQGDRSRRRLCCGTTSVWSALLPRFSHVYWTSATLLYFWPAVEMKDSMFRHELFG